MDTDTPPRSIGWMTVAGLLGFGAVAVLVASLFLGSQVGGILSTVGSSVCGPCDGADNGTGSDSGTGSGSGTGSDSGTGSGTGSGSQGSGSGVVLAVPRDDLLVIKTGHMSVQVTDIGTAITSSTDAIAALGGYASGSKRSGTGHETQASVTFRIPSARWDAALNAVRSIGDVLGEETSTEDVTSDVVDLGARIRNLQVTERALQSIMDRAAVIKDVLTVQEQLTQTRGEIEKLTAEKAHLEEQAAFSTLTATFQLQPEPAIVVAQTSGFDPAKEVDGATAKLIRALQRVARAGIWFGIVWLPILLAVVIAVAVAVVIGRRLARRWGRSSAAELVEVGGR